jgi:exopolyphosphatase / guanosine-5'-triphosphate,3'-diphosphate pyrophosphatase
MRLAIIDTGTNTFHLLIVEQNGNSYIELYKTKEGVKLGEAGITTNVISPAAFERGINVFKEFKRKCEIHGATKIFALGTAALRNASNASEFIEKVKKETGIELIVISGEIEAELIWNGVRHSMKMGLDKSLIMDIGGGSVEFIICNEEEIFWKQSFDIGAALLLEKFKPSDPISTDDIQKLETFFGEELKLLFHSCGVNLPKQLIGSSGSFDTFTEMIVHKYHNIETLNGLTEFTFNIDEYKAIHQQLLASTHDERIAMPGMIAMRADMIVVASILLSYVKRNTNIKQIKSSTYSLKEGILFKLIK